MFIDLSRCSYSRVYEQIVDLFETYSKRLQEKGVAGLRLKSNKQRKYHLRLPGKLLNNGALNSFREAL